MTTLRIPPARLPIPPAWRRMPPRRPAQRSAALLPYRQKIIHARWSGEACWIPLGDFALGVGYENHTSHPAPGELLWYPGGFSETELLFPYGAGKLRQKLGQLAGNHFLTVVEGREQLREMGRTIWRRARTDRVRAGRDHAHRCAYIESRPRIEQNDRLVWRDPVAFEQAHLRR